MKLDVLANGSFVTVSLAKRTVQLHASLHAVCLPNSSHVSVHPDAQTMLGYNTSARYQCQIAYIIGKTRFKSLPCCLKVGLHTMILSIAINTYLNINKQQHK